MTEQRYIIFPIELLKTNSIKEAINNAFNYAIYKKAESSSYNEAMIFFGITGDEKRIMSCGKQLFDSLLNVPMVSVKKDILLQFYKEPKTDFEISVFRAYCALKSIVGTKNYKKATNIYVLSRMFGYASVEEFEKETKKPKYYTETFFCEDAKKQKRKIEYQLTKKIIRDELVLRWDLAYCSVHNRGFYFSFIISFDSLYKFALIQKNTFQQNEQRRKENEAMKRVNQELGL